MTSTKQDKELREKLTKLISQDGWVDIQEVDVDGQVNELMQLITAYTNKQIEEVLDRLESKLVERRVDNAPYAPGKEYLVPEAAIEAERNKLKESKNDKL